MKEDKRIIDLVSKEVQRIIDEKYKRDDGRLGDDYNERYKVTFIISTMLKKGYLLTLICNREEGAFDYRQSEFITLDTDLEETIEFLYNRTM